MDTVRAAFRDECARLEEVLGGLTAADLDRPTPCPPWAVRDLLAHVRTGAGRLVDMLAAPAPDRAEVDAAGYFGRAKFTPEVDRDRIDSARREAGAPAGVPEVAGGFARAWRAADAAVAAQPPGRLVRTRHGDTMTLTEFLRTRVVEVGVHGLDLADALDRRPWLTPTAADVLAGLLTGGRPLPAGLGWDALTLSRKATGRAAITDRERALIDSGGLGELSFGG
ncbi:MULTISPECIES: maleylpyruvate isomerase N-terminal domain-containing protein [Micromonospora]|uniref:Maleylpyruvate isomerase family mycothiol-dependent enzyme n=1 Tax=Micromonospora solifontis TaxID=2487138 RepID=A0ABX9WKS6_9ACTN|nr:MULTISPECIES: maleylpyruvate isomerase N-terminal domain-containing protein [Micromonospora]NES14628.1 maleylpyruvate isomerase family protein [Micromonospora sp. PPF5-17B]NES35234.1 maleylpyruvate isomerase family protein [Micromonospora solifontis]NES58404.1 maleylpyruvate isomerase family protein [Micromonospora sp. PPF5-6]RNM00966.1 maleylpyruvate isomerase family mycothiol-dependent enzyme [Micromonospora solifontis]